MDPALIAHDFAAMLNQQRAKNAAAGSPLTPVETHIGVKLVPGTRVLDLVTGLEGVVIAATVTHRIIQPAKPATADSPRGATV